MKRWEFYPNITSVCNGKFSVLVDGTVVGVALFPCGVIHCNCTFIIDVELDVIQRHD